MVLLRPQTVFAAVMGVPPDRAYLALSGVQLVSRGAVTWAKKAGWLRNPPITAAAPTKAQVDVWLKVRSAASAVKGRTGLTAEGLPQAASAVKAQLTGYRSPYRMTELVRRRLHNLDVLARRYGLG